MESDSASPIVGEEQAMGCGTSFCLVVLLVDKECLLEICQPRCATEVCGLGQMGRVW